MDAKFTKRFHSFKRSLDSLAEAQKRDLADSFVLSGTGAKFNITFELSWKVMKDILVQHYAINNFITGSPKEVLKQAFKANLITSPKWLEMLKIRNELSHDYDEEIIRTCCSAIIEIYIPLFYEFEQTVSALDFSDVTYTSVNARL